MFGKYTYVKSFSGVGVDTIRGVEMKVLRGVALSEFSRFERVFFGRTDTDDAMDAVSFGAREELVGSPVFWVLLFVIF